MATLRRRKQIWYISFYHKGRRHKISTRTANHTIAKTVFESIQKKLVLGEFNIEDYDRPDITLSELETTYFENVVGVKMKSTIAGHRIYFTSFKKILGNVPLSAVDLVMLERWRATRLTQVQPVTVNIERSALSAIFSKAVEYGFIKDNPFKKLTKMKIEERRLYLTVEEENLFMVELDKLIASTGNKQYRKAYMLFKQFVQFQLDTGMRREETIALCAQHIDFDRNLIMIERTKGKTTREIPMTHRVRAIVDSLGEKLFHDLSVDQVSRKFTLVAKGANISDEFKQHSLRHTFATRLLALGVDISIVSKLLGHRNIETTMIYAKATLDTLRGAVKTMDEFRARQEREILSGLKLGTVENNDVKMLES